MNEFERSNADAVKTGDDARQELVKLEFNTEDRAANRAGDFKAQAQEYGQKFQDAAGKAKTYATEKYNLANDKLKELQAKDPKELVEDAKTYAREKPGQTILISAAVGLALGLLLRGRK